MVYSIQGGGGEKKELQPEVVRMETLTIQLSDQSIITLPADLAQQAGFAAGDSVEAVLTEQGLTLALVRDYKKLWQVMERGLRYQALALELIQPDKRGDAYWQVVDPMLQDLERDLSS